MVTRFAENNLQQAANLLRSLLIIIIIIIIITNLYGVLRSEDTEALAAQKDLVSLNS